MFGVNLLLNSYGTKMTLYDTSVYNHRGNTHQLIVVHPPRCLNHSQLHFIMLLRCEMKKSNEKTKNTTQKQRKQIPKYKEKIQDENIR